MPRKEGMERKDLLAANVKIFKVNPNKSLQATIDTMFVNEMHSKCN